LESLEAIPITSPDGEPLGLALDTRRDPSLRVPPVWLYGFGLDESSARRPDAATRRGSDAGCLCSLPARSPDGRTYTFRIRPGFRFSPPSNQQVTAQTFKGSIERTLNPRTHSPLAQFLSDVAGARAYMAGKTSQITG
jgi:ABC-type transport system substrate-binding protein